MKLPFFRKPVRYVPSQQEGSLQAFRERNISILLGSASTLGALAFIAALIPALRAHQYWAIVIYSFCYAWILIVTLQKQRFSYAVKIYSLVFLFYILGLLNLVQNGLSADAGVFLLTFTIVASLMIGPRSGIVALVISVGTFSLVGVLMSSGKLAPTLLTSYREPLDWISGGVVLMLIGTIFVLSLNTILQGLNDSITKAKMLAMDADRDRDQLQQRSQDLRRRLAQLRAAAEIEHTTSAVLDPHDLMQKVVDLLSERFGLYFVGIFLLSENELALVQTEGEGISHSGAVIGRSSTACTAAAHDGTEHRLDRSATEVVLQAGTDKIVPEGYKLAISESSSLGWPIFNRKPHTVDISSKKDEFTTTYLPLARTELVLPLLNHNRVFGALMINSTQANAFDVDDIALFQSSVESLMTALENARLFKQNQDDLEEIRALQRQYLSRTWAETEQVHGNLSYTYEDGTEHRDGTEHGEQNTVTDGTLSTYSIPISLRDQTIGKFILEAANPTWSKEERVFIEAMLTEAALALENAHLLDVTQRQANHDRFIADITRNVRTSASIESILSTAIRELGRNLGASEAIISLNAVSGSKGQDSMGWTGVPGSSHGDGNKDVAGRENPTQLADDGTVAVKAGEDRPITAQREVTE